MLEIFNEKDFIQMPWKNGGGVTSELYLINDIFRLSRASVSSNGPFSLFPKKDRILVLLEGNGFSLNEKIMNEIYVPYEFSGEEQINCTLSNGPCIDFNVMSDADAVKASLSIIDLAVNESLILKAQTNYKFIYDHMEKTLYKLENSDRIGLSTTKKKKLIIIDVSLKNE